MYFNDFMYRDCIYSFFPPCVCVHSDAGSPPVCDAVDGGRCGSRHRPCHASDVERPCSRHHHHPSPHLLGGP